MTAEPADALVDLHTPARGWTTDDLDALPEGHRRYELIDGALIVSPSPTSIHQILSMRLGAALDASCPAEYEVVEGVEVRISTQRSFIPDVLVMTETAASRGPSHVGPHEVVLAVEVVSPGSVTMDRITKAALYAQAGIPYYWRVELTEGIAIHTHRLDVAGSVYVPTGEFSETLAVDEPWRVELAIKRITPRHYAPGSADDLGR